MTTKTKFESCLTGPHCIGTMANKGESGPSQRRQSRVKTEKRPRRRPCRFSASTALMPPGPSSLARVVTKCAKRNSTDLIMSMLRARAELARLRNCYGLWYKVAFRQAQVQVYLDDLDSEGRAGRDLCRRSPGRRSSAAGDEACAATGGHYKRLRLSRAGAYCPPGDGLYGAAHTAPRWPGDSTGSHSHPMAAVIGF